MDAMLWRGPTLACYGAGFEPGRSPDSTQHLRAQFQKRLRQQIRDDSERPDQERQPVCLAYLDRLCINSEPSRDPFRTRQNFEKRTQKSFVISENGQKRSQNEAKSQNSGLASNSISLLESVAGSKNGQWERRSKPRTKPEEARRSQTRPVDELADRKKAS